ncbi:MULTISPECIES: molybdopterin converting factor subunit 1 [Bacteroidota]|jgi:molybdopterin synthase sulfur carrier subunit|uniref:Molybdopterin synthase sulfur carrier subunit n=1 Tax=Flectobacillus rivi TaxID=2984209 RepID=A0ABT6Z2Q0_9BACT|nr:MULTISPECIES: molybdopterin converting factor subunit 1 [Bacteroidota]MDI9875372.1 molybdopterin converting factor subunit 1 [Flectobacillus rivi]NBB27296.1 molybdopterin converting factor subunit 1 [Cellulophaga sp. BC115SP]
MKYTIALFGITKEIVGNSSTTLEVSDTLTTDGLLTLLRAEYPQLAAIRSLLLAVNNEYAEQDLVLSERDEIALIPPVSGG